MMLPHYDEHVPESSIEILGHALGVVTYRHYAHRAPLAFSANFRRGKLTDIFLILALI